MLINKFNPAFPDSTGTERIPFVGECPGISQQITPTGVSLIRNSVSNQYIPATFSLSAEATGQLPILYTWQSGSSEAGPYADYPSESGYGKYFLNLTATSSNVNKWYRLKATNNEACTGYSSGVFVSSTDYIDSGTCIITFHSLYEGGTFCRNPYYLDQYRGSIYLNPYKEKVDGTPDPWNTSPSCEWNGNYYSDRKLFKSDGSEITISDINNYNQYLYDKYRPYWGTWWNYPYYNYYDWWDWYAYVDKLDWSSYFGTTYAKDSFYFLLDNQSGPHIPTGTTWGTGQYFIAYYPPEEKTDYYCRSWDNYTKKLRQCTNTQSDFSEDWAFPRYGSLSSGDITGSTSSLPTSGGYPPGGGFYVPIVELSSGQQINIYDTNYNPSHCGNDCKNLTITLRYAFKGHTLSSAAITGSYDLLSGFSTLQDVVNSGIYNVNKFSTTKIGNGGLYDPIVLNNWCDCEVDPSSDPCNGIGGAKYPDRCQKPIYYTIGEATLDGTQPNFYCSSYSLAPSIIVSENMDYYDGLQSGATIQQIDFSSYGPGELIYLGAVKSEDRISIDGNPVVKTSFVKTNGFQGYYQNICEITDTPGSWVDAIHYYCNGTEYGVTLDSNGNLIPDASPCVYSVGSSWSNPRFFSYPEETALTAVEVDVDCGSPYPTDADECGYIGDDYVYLFKCRQFASYANTSPKLCGSKSFCINTSSDGAITVLVEFYSTSSFDLPPSIP
jgi:hypothetical protein